MLDTNPLIIATTEIAVACAAGDEVTRRRIDVALSRGPFEIVARTDDVEALIEACLDAPVEALVVALGLSTLSPTGELRLLRCELPDTPIVVVALKSGRTAVRKALAAGAQGFVPEPELEDVLPLAVRAVCAGQICVPQQMGDQLERPAFSIRERQVLELVGRGFTNGEIAQQLYLAESTVKSHLSSSFRKLGINSRKQAAAIVLDPDNGLGLGLGLGTTTTHWDRPSLAVN